MTSPGVLSDMLALSITMTVRHDMITVFVTRQVEGGWQVLMLRRAPGKYMGGTWAIVRGGMEAGETAVQSALRELREETGQHPMEFYRCGSIEAFYIAETDTLHHGIAFVAILPADVQVTLNDEHDDFRWLPLAEYQAQTMWASERQVFAEAKRDILNAGPGKRYLQVRLS